MFVLLPVWWDVVEKSVKPDVRETRSGALKFDESSFHVFFRGLAKLLGATSVHAQNLLYFLFCIGHEGLLKLFHTWVHATDTLLICTGMK